MINVGSLVSDPFAAQSFMIKRSSGSWLSGKWQNTKTDVPGWGSIQIANAEDLQIVPEADRVGGAIKLYTEQPIYRTREPDDDGDGGGLSDQILWHGELYKIIDDAVWSDFGFYKVIGVRIKGA